MSLFPIIQPQTAYETEKLPLCREVAWNYESDAPVYKNGTPVIVQGAEAVKVWAWNALHTVRKKHVIFTWNYGSDLENLMGQPYSDQVKTLEAKRYLKECLLINPYISDVTDIMVSFDSSRLDLSCKIHTLYGDIEVKGG